MYDSLSTIAEGVQKAACIPSLVHGSEKVKNHYETGSNLLAISSLVSDWTKLIHALKGVQNPKITLSKKCTKVALEAMEFLYSLSQTVIFLNDKKLFPLTRSVPVWNGIYLGSSLAIDSCEAATAWKAVRCSQFANDRYLQKKDNEAHWARIGFVKSVFSIFATCAGVGTAIFGCASSMYLGVLKGISLLCSGVYYLLKNYLFYFKPVP